MIKMTLKEISEHLQGELLGDGTVTVDRVETDSRKDVAGALFVALRGETFDGHTFLEKVAEAGAAAVLTEEKKDIAIPQIIVKDTLKGLGLIGQLNRRKSHAVVVGITGTCGKTTVKEMTAAILSLKGKTIATKGNFNNSVGVPLTLLSIDADTEYAVVEHGASHPDDIAYTVQFSEPVAALINNVGGAHLEGFGGFEGVYHAKREILDFVLQHKGQGAVNADSEFYDSWLKDYKEYNLKSFAVENPKADFRAENITQKDAGNFAFTLVTPMGKHEVALNIPGRHNISNALAAATLSSMVGATLSEIVQGLSQVKPVKGRLFIEKLGDLTLIDDAYNASFNAVKASLDTLSLLPGHRVFVFGDMGELGKEALDLHRKVGEYAKGRTDEFWSLGSLAKESALVFGGRVFEDRAELLEAVRKLVRETPNLTITAKGSHGMKMGDIVDTVRLEKNTVIG